MARIAFTSNIQRHVACPTEDVDGATVKEALAAYLRRHPKVQSYLLDDRGSLRFHMNLFVDGEAIVDRAGLSDRIGAESELHVFQALSGG